MEPGQVLNDRYRIERRIGRGGQGSVYLARHLMLDGEVAIKELVLHGANPSRQASVLRQFTAEARTLSQLRHPSLPRVQDFFAVDDCRYFLVMDLIDGETLKQRLNRLGPQPPDLVLSWGRMLCDILKYLHSHTPQVILRDLKPENVMIEVSGQIKVIDFGIAKVLDPASNQLETGTQARGAGTPGYAAIEQYSVGTDPRTDIYALGATLYCMLAGQPPPESPRLAARLATLKPISTLRKDVPQALSDAIDFMLRLAASERPQCVDDVLQLLSPAGLGQVDNAALPTRMLRPSRGDGASGPAQEKRADHERGQRPRLPGTVSFDLPLETGPGLKGKRARRDPRVLAALGSIGVIMVGGVAIYSLSRPTDSLLVPSPSPIVASVSASPSPVTSPVAAAALMYVRVVGTPAASVQVDDEDRGQVGSVESRIPIGPGSHHVRIQSLGYEPFETNVEGSAGDEPIVSYALRAQDSKMRIHGTPGTRVTLGSRYLGTVNDNHILDVDNVSPKQYVLHGEPPQGPAFTMQVVVLPAVFNDVFCPTSPGPARTYIPRAEHHPTYAPREAPPIRDGTPPQAPPIRG